METLKCIGLVCPNCYRHDFYGSHFICGLNQASFSEEKRKDKICPVHDVIGQKYGEISKLKDLARLIESGEENEDI